MDPTSENRFPRENCTIDRVRQIVIICEKKVEKSVPFQNGGNFTGFPFARLLTKIEKSLSRRRISTKFDSN